MCNLIHHWHIIFSSEGLLTTTGKFLNRTLTRKYSYRHEYQYIPVSSLDASPKNTVNTTQNFVRKDD